MRSIKEECLDRKILFGEASLRTALREFDSHYHSESVRRARGGRKAVKKTPEVIEAIRELMQHDTAGDPVHGLKWTRKTTEKIAGQLKELGIDVSANTGFKNIRAYAELGISTNLVTTRFTGTDQIGVILHAKGQDE